MRKINFSTWSVPVALLVVCLLAFGVLIPWLGFYWDDWPSIWFLHFGGSSSFMDVFAVDRPPLAWLFTLTTRIVGESTLGWQIFALITRWGCCLALWWALKTLWPAHTRPVTLVALLFAVYPGFRQQYISVTYSHDWLVQSFFFVSLGLMILTCQPNRWRWLQLVASLLLAAYVMFADEYYFGLELLRPAMLWIALTPMIASSKKRLRQVLIIWLPYVVVMAAFLFWRLVIFESPRGDVQVFSQLESAPLQSVIILGRTVLSDVLQTGLLAWVDTLNLPRMLGLGTATNLIYLAAALTAGILVFFYLIKFTGKGAPTATRESLRHWSLQAIALGTLALFVGGIPFWVTAYPIELNFPWDRFTLPMALGSSLLLAGLIALIPGPRVLQSAAIATLIALAVGFHIYNGTLFRREWASQRDFFWQLAWRAPGLQTGTAVMTADLPFNYFSDNSLTAPLNWLYAPDNTIQQLPYLFYNLESRQDKQLTNLKPGSPIEIPYRTAVFTGNTNQALALFYEPPGCVNIADPEVDAALPQKPRYFSEVLPLSDITRILPEIGSPAQPPEHILGPEPEHGWCYYYEKADLARQVGDWAEVVRLAGEARALNTRLYEVNAPELVPYIEGFAHQGEWDDALSTTREAYELTFRMKRMLCTTWNRIEQDTEQSNDQQSALITARQELGCQSP